MAIKSCKNCNNCCPKDGYPCSLWEMLSDEVSEEILASDCNNYVGYIKEEPEVERPYSPWEVYSASELITGKICRF